MKRKIAANSIFSNSRVSISSANVFYSMDIFAFSLALAFTLICCALGFLFLFRGKSMSAEEEMAATAAAEQRQTGASMMEQLVPEITTHTLSYLDYPSLCRLSMTNSHMRMAANDDGAWKALYHKDFTVEQSNITPVNGWKAYYAATRAIMNVNADFFNVIRQQSLPAMGRLWLNADYVKCIHVSTGELFSGYNSVVESFPYSFLWDEGIKLEVHDIKVRVLTDMAWITMKVYINEAHATEFNMTNVFEFHNGSWFMVHHHSSQVFVQVGEE